MRADEGVDIAKMAVNCFLALIVLSAVIGLLALSQRMWNVFSREQSQNEINQEYAEVAAYDNNVVTGQDLVSIFMGTKGKMPILIGATPSDIHDRNNIITEVSSFDSLAAHSGRIGLRGYMGDFQLAQYISDVFKNTIYIYAYGSSAGGVDTGGQVHNVTAGQDMYSYLKLEGTNLKEDEVIGNYGVKSINYNELGNPVKNGTLLPKVQEYIKREYKEIAGACTDTFPGTTPPLHYYEIKDVTNETYGYWYSVVVFEDEQCTRPCAIYVEPVYYEPPSTT